MNKKGNLLAGRLVGVLLAIGMSAFSTSANAQKSYGPYPDETYTECGTNQTTTAVVLVHGGWNTSGSTANPNAVILCNALGKRRLHVYSINYRLAVREGQGFPAQLQDVQMALRWVKSLGTYKRVVLIGMSAGGYDAELATFMDTTADWAATDPMRESQKLPDYSSRADAVVLVSPFSDLTDPKLWPAAVQAITRDIVPPGTDVMSLIPLVIASPLAHIKADIAPTLVIHGSNDATVPFAQSQLLAKEMAYIGAPFRLVATTSDHVFAGYTPTDLNRIIRMIGDCAVGAAGTICAPPGTVVKSTH